MKKTGLKMLAGVLLCALATAGAAKAAIAETTARADYTKPWKNDGDAAKRWSMKIQKRMSRLYDGLKLEPSQEPAWKDYQEVVSSTLQAHKQREQSKTVAMTAPERMEKMYEKVKEREVVMARLLEATKTFYSQLTPEQQRIFDAEVLSDSARKRSRSRI